MLGLLDPLGEGVEGAVGGGGQWTCWLFVFGGRPQLGHNVLFVVEAHLRLIIMNCKFVKDVSVFLMGHSG